MGDPHGLASKLARLRAILSDMPSALVCFSGGVDSAFLLRVAHDVLGSNAIALTAHSPSLPSRELRAAEDFAKAIGIRHIIHKTHEVENPEYAANPHNRCYFCKSELLSVAARIAAEQQAAYILLGTNIDDLGQHRPGLKAASENAARHPLAEARLSKQEVRELSQQLGLPTWDKPEMACLASRFAYGVRITPERLDKIERFEAALSDLGFRGMRVRYHEQMARIELRPEEMSRILESNLRQKISRLGHELGFAFVTLDLDGYRRGSLNTVLSESQRQPPAGEVKSVLS